MMASFKSSNIFILPPDKDIPNSCARHTRRVTLSGSFPLALQASLRLFSAIVIDLQLA